MSRPRPHVRIWLKDSERLPDPVPATTDDRKVVLVGLILWVLTLAGLLLFLRPLLAGGHGFWLWTALVGIVLGIAGLVYTSVREAKRNHGPSDTPDPPVTRGRPGPTAE